jgi:cytochrome c oxidase subunit IV
MAEEKMNGKCYGHASKIYIFFGVLAIVYGIINYMISVMNWQPYMAWVVGGIILLLIAWAKGSTAKS